MTLNSVKPVLYVIINNHFDLTWRRCWQRPFTFQGQTFVSYTDIETYYLLDNIALAQRCPDYKFEAESTQVVRKFIDRCPDQLPVLQQLAREGRFAITGGGEAIVDANMITGESLVRNYVDGLLWVEETFGQKTRLAVRNDAFGNSAQLPQILRGVEIAWATGMSYSPADGLYWRGLDGSTILHKTLPIAAWGGGVEKYLPCPECYGTGLANGAPCTICQGRGIEPSLRARLPESVDREALIGFGAGLIWITPEEQLPNPDLLKWVEDMRQEYEVRFALEEDVLPYLRPWLDAVDNPPDDCLHPSVELNPNNSGCLVTRIKTKQTVRRQEYALLAAETLSAMAALKGGAFPKDQFKQVRQNQYFTMFHDSITATHVDAAYQELMDIAGEVEQGITGLRSAALGHLVQAEPGSGCISVINPTGQAVTGICTVALQSTNAPSALIDEQGQSLPVWAARQTSGGGVEIRFLARAVPPFSARSYRFAPSGQPAVVESLPDPVIENSRFRIEADTHGLLSVFDKTLGQPVLISGAYRPGEFILEHDEGSPWATLSPDQRRTTLAPYTRLVSAEKTAGLQRLVFELRAPRELGFSGGCLNATLTVNLVEGLDRVDFKVHAAWNAFNHRLRVAMPVPRRGECRHQYEVPYGIVTRQPYEPSFRWAGANGDWPAVNWAGVEQPGLSVALFNQGTPSYRMETSQAEGLESSEVILLSILRSPNLPTYLHEPEFYSMTDFIGMRDEGEHDFEYAVTAYAQPLAESSVVLDADAYNTSLIAVEGSADLPAMPQLQAEAARISAVKWAEDGSGLVLRLVEFRGQGGPTELNLPFPVTSAERVNLLERQPQSLPVSGGCIRCTLRPWEIATIKLTF